jgi:hypothetical protein
VPGITSSDNAELVAARKKFADLETELAVTSRANELLKEAVIQGALCITQDLPEVAEAVVSTLQLWLV